MKLDFIAVWIAKIASVMPLEVWFWGFIILLIGVLIIIYKKMYQSRGE